MFIKDEIQTKKGAKVIIDTLRALGVDTIFGYPGGAVLNIYDYLYKYKDKIVLPIDVTTENGQNISLENLNGQIGFDIGIKSQELFKETLSNAKRVIINGPLGMFEKKPFEQGTKSIYQFLIDNNIKTIIGGGDTAASAVALGFKDKFYHISTGGGATLEYLEGKILPGISVINEKETI